MPPRSWQHEGGNDVDGVDLGPDLRCGRFQVGVRDDPGRAGVVDEDVETPVLRDDRGHQSPGRLGSGHVGLAIGTTDLGRHRLTAYDRGA